MLEVPGGLEGHRQALQLPLPSRAGLALGTEAGSAWPEKRQEAWDFYVTKEESEEGALRL